MPDILRRPVIGVAGALIATILLISLDPSWKADVLLAWKLAGVLLVVLFVHELGHVVFGSLTGMKLHFFTFGPFSITMKDGRLTFNENKQWLFFGGVASLIPYPWNTPDLKRKLLLYTVGGPVFSFLGAIIAFGCWRLTVQDWLSWLAILNLVIFFATAPPLPNGMFRTDGTIALLLLGNNGRAAEHLHLTQVTAEMMSGKRPKTWDTALVESCEARIRGEHDKMQSIGLYLFLFYYYSDKNGLLPSISYIEPIVREPVTQQNSVFKSSFHSSYMMYRILYEGEDVTAAEMKALFQPVSLLDLYSYYRSLAIVKYTEHRTADMRKALHKAEKQLKQETASGYMELEREWFDRLKRRLTC
ncbi:M50 family metallopeptidase [Paenibacillus profundus]|uniref:M50 family metallopeptidase n=1 Tax=Paenibacillus profundus TaxID=1173085 RepID=A0ABS8YP37_9BACL|nr:M50 family metallopeptidase [Paenibacillus profundus]MCE5173037.1 M50 family metallopeptidase [Paenibacillus profundus]